MICPWYFHWDLADFHHPVMLDDTRARSPARSGAAPKGTRGPPAAFGWTAATVGLETFSLALVLSSHELFFPSFMIPSKNPMKFIPIVQICSNIKKKKRLFLCLFFCWLTRWPPGIRWWQSSPLASSGSSTQRSTMTSCEATASSSQVPRRRAEGRRAKGRFCRKSGFIWEIMGISGSRGTSGSNGNNALVGIWDTSSFIFLIIWIFAHYMGYL